MASGPVLRSDSRRLLGRPVSARSGLWGKESSGADVRRGSRSPASSGGRGELCAGAMTPTWARDSGLLGHGLTPLGRRPAHLPVTGRAASLSSRGSRAHGPLCVRVSRPGLHGRARRSVHQWAAPCWAPGGATQHPQQSLSVVPPAQLFPGRPPVRRLLEMLQEWLASLPLDRIPYNAVLDLVDNKMRVSPAAARPSAPAPCRQTPSRRHAGGAPCPASVRTACSPPHPTPTPAAVCRLPALRSRTVGDSAPCPGSGGPQRCGTGTFAVDVSLGGTPSSP